MLSLWPAGAALAPASTLRKARVYDSVLRQRVAAQGLVIARYGDFDVAEVEEGFFSKVDAKGYAWADHENVIELQNRRIDTRAAGVQAARKSIGDYSGKRLHLVQFAGPVKAEWRQSLEQNGLRVVSYVPQNSFLVYGSADELRTYLQGRAKASEVQWDGAFQDAYKLHPTLAAGAVANQPVAGDLFAIQLVDDPAANPDTVKWIERSALAPIQQQRRVLSYLNLIGTIAGGKPDRVEQPGGRSLHSSLPHTDQAGRAAGPHRGG